jgi:diadenosine tetraphosphatase ApaH/serine/threonine PP2A family protein phosphatase
MLWLHMMSMELLSMFRSTSGAKAGSGNRAMSQTHRKFGLKGLSTEPAIERSRRPASAWRQLLTASLLLHATAFAAPNDWSDGPYLQFQGERQLTARWICNGQPKQQQLLASQPVPALCGYRAPIQLNVADQQQQPLTLPNWQFKANRIAAISDIHGQYALMLRLLQAAGVLDATGHWQFADGHLVIVGDVMDRGDGVTPAFWQLYQLQQQAAAAGGKVHLLPGNHETMVLRGDLRYLHEHYQQTTRLLNQSQQQLYAPDTVLGQWLRRQPLFIRINDTLFVHGGLSPAYAQRVAQQGVTAEQVLSAYQQSLGKSRDAIKAEPLQAFLQGSDGPLWYRGYFRRGSDFTPDVLRTLLQTLGASRIVVGHTTMDQVYQHHGGLVLSTDSDIKDGEQGEVLHFAAGQWFKTGLDGVQRPLADGAHQHKNKK